jgi:hypothetical protein
MPDSSGLACYRLSEIKVVFLLFHSIQIACEASNLKVAFWSESEDQRSRIHPKPPIAILWFRPLHFPVVEWFAPAPDVKGLLGITIRDIYRGLLVILVRTTQNNLDRLVRWIILTDRPSSTHIL